MPAPAPFSKRAGAKRNSGGLPKSKRRRVPNARRRSRPSAKPPKRASARKRRAATRRRKPSADPSRKPNGGSAAANRLRRPRPRCAGLRLRRRRRLCRCCRPRAKPATARAPRGGRGGGQADHPPARPADQGRAAAEAHPRRRAEESRPPHRHQRHRRGRGADALRRLLPPACPAPQGSCGRPGQGKALARNHPARDDHHPGTRQPHGRTRRRRDQAA